MSEPAADLSLATTAELIEELKSRSSALVIGLDPKADRGCFTLCQHGSKLANAGLLRVLTLESDHGFMNDPRD
jgi:hypothetical protein